MSAESGPAGDRRGRGTPLRQPGLQTSLQAGLSVLQSVHPLPEFTINKLADEVGVSQAAIYLHYGSRNEIAGEAALAARHDHDARLRAEIAALPGPRRRRLEGNFDWSLASPDVRQCPDGCPDGADSPKPAPRAAATSSR